MSQAGALSNIGGTGDVSTINNINPAISGNFNINAGTNVTITPGTNSISISSSGAGLTGITESTTPFATALGVGALVSNTGVQNTGVGYQALNANISGFDNVAYGYQSQLSMVSGSYNTSCGSASLKFNQDGTENCAFGDGALYGIIHGTDNCAFGGTALGGLVDMSYCIGIGTNTLKNNYEDANIAIGYQALINNTFGLQQTAIGHEALGAATSAGYSTAVGYQALTLCTGGNSTAVGAGALSAVAGGQNNLALGYNAGSANTGFDSSNIYLANNGNSGESNTIRIGVQGSSAGQQNKCFIAGITGVTVSSSNFVTINTSTGQLGTTSTTPSGIVTLDGDTGSATGSAVTLNANSDCGSSWKFVASGATINLNPMDANYNIFLGPGAGNSGVSGIANVGIGYDSCNTISTGIGNCCVGYSSGSSLTSGNAHTFIGESCGSTMTGGTGNCALGAFALGYADLATYNICIGNLAANNYTGAEDSNIVIGNAGTTGDTHTIRIGTNGGASKQQSACYVAGIYGVSVTSGSAALVNSAGQIGTVVSSKRYKENIEDLGTTTSDLYNLRPVSFNYISDATKELHYGLIAEEVDVYFPKLIIRNSQGQPDTIKYHEMSAMLVNELKKLRDDVDELKTKLAIEGTK